MNKLFTKANYFFISVIIVLTCALTPANARTFRAALTTPAKSAGKSVITAALQVITFNPLPAVTYGAADFSPGASSDNSGTTITYSSDNTAVATIVNGNIHIVGAGSANITASQTGETSVVQPLTVNQAPLTITPNNVTKTYGVVLTGAAGSTAFTTSGLQNGETISSITTTYTSGSAATDGVGTYTNCVGIGALGSGTFNANNYAITYASGNIIVNTAALTITANTVTKVYGTTLTGGAGSTAFTSTGLQNGETVGSVSINYGPGSAKTDASGTYTGSSTAAFATGGTFAAFDYTITYVAGDVVVGGAPLTIKARNKTIRQGSAIPTLTVNYKGFVNGDTQASLTSQPTITTTATSSSPVGVYPIVASGAVDPNYTITYVAGTLAITSPDDASLRNLRLSSGTLSPAFDTDTKSYTIGGEYGNKTTSITVTPVSSNPNSTITVDGNSVKSGKGSVVPLSVGSNTITVVVVSKDGQATETYTLTVTRLALTNAYLSFLKIDNGQFALTPSFVFNTLGYAATVPYSNSSITVTPSAFTGQSETIAVNGTPVTSGSASGAIALTQGDNTITILVTAEDGTTTQTYTLTVTRAAPIPSDASLANLTISGGVLSPAFAATVTSYTINGQYGNQITSATITPTATSPNSTITINGNPVVSGSGSVLSLAIGSNTFAVKVLSQDGSKSKTYTLTVTRLPLTNAYLSYFKLNSGQFALSPSFVYTTLNYTANVPANISTVTVTADLFNGANETVTVNGTPVTSQVASSPIALKQGANTITLLVTAEDGITTETYTVTVTRAAPPLSSDAYLSYLRLTGGNATLSPAFDYTTTSYTATVPSSTSSITITPSSIDKNAVIEFNNAIIVSGSTSAPISLVTGPNPINITVTAQDGVTTLTYTVIVTKTAGTGSDNSLYQSLGVAEAANTPQLANDGIVVHQGVSPNGDGVNDFLMIDGIGNYPDNKLMIMNRNGQMIFEAKNYDNSNRVFDGHSNKSGAMQLPGTYFYSLDYAVKGVTMHKTGFIVLKY